MMLRKRLSLTILKGRYDEAAQSPQSTRSLSFVYVLPCAKFVTVACCAERVPSHVST
jgi:hypothetical protein